MRKIVAVAAALALSLSACAHGIRNLSDCKQVEGEQRIECGVCVAQNEAQGWLRTNEYWPDAKPGERCRPVK